MGSFKREIRLLLQALEAGYHRQLIASEEPEITKIIIAKKFHDEYGISKEMAEETINTLAAVLVDGGKSEEEKAVEKIAKLEKAAKDGDLWAQYELGVLFRELKRFEEASEWLEKAAKKGLELYASVTQGAKEKPSEEERILVSSKYRTNRSF